MDAYAGPVDAQWLSGYSTEPTAGPPTGKRLTIKDDYFLKYNPNGDPYDSDQQWTTPTLDYGCRFILRDWHHTMEINGYSAKAAHLTSVLDLGAATGGLLAKLSERHPEISFYGVESAKWAKKHVLPEWADRIRFGDWLDVSKEYADGQFDLVIDCVAQYIPKRNLRYSLAEVRRVAQKGVITVVNTLEDGNLQDGYRQTTKSDKWWRKKFNEQARDGVYQSDTGLFIWR